MRQDFVSKSLLLDSYELSKLSVKDQCIVRSSLMGYMPQTGGLIPYLTIKENLKLQIEVSADSFYKLEGKKLDTKALYQEVHEKMSQFSMDSLLDRYPHELSIGQRQRAVFLKLSVTNLRLFLLMNLPHHSILNMAKSYLKVLSPYQDSLICVL